MEFGARFEFSLINAAGLQHSMFPRGIIEHVEREINEANVW
jgi:hypothetical protein